MTEYVNDVFVIEDLKRILRLFERSDSNRQRRDILTNLLNTYQIPFYINKKESDGLISYNICVPLTNQFKELVVIGAHYDVVDHSSGMNDNLASVAILVVLLKRLMKVSQKIPLEIVFFDMEEMGRVGSKAYAAANKDRVKFMINLDVCGYGEKIVHTSEHKAYLEKGDLLLTKIAALPESDDWSFCEAGIKSMSVAILPNDDINILKGCKDLKNILHTDRRSELFDKLQIVKTTHGGELDGLEYLTFHIMAKLVKLIELFIIEKWLKKK